MTATYETNLNELLSDIQKMLIVKHHDYGSDNLKKRGMLGIMTRLDDKMARIDILLEREPFQNPCQVTTAWEPISRSFSLHLSVAFVVVSRKLGTFFTSPKYRSQKITGICLAVQRISEVLP